MMMKGYWETLERHGRDNNPYRAGFAQVVVVADTDEEAERIYTPHLKYFYEKSLFDAPYHGNIPGYSTRKSLKAMIEKSKAAPPYVPGTKTSWKALVEDHGVVIAGSPDTVVDQLTEAVKRLRVGHLMVLLQVGSMDNELTSRNITLFGEKVLPRIRHLWDDEGWEDHWWPQGAGDRSVATPQAGAAS
jgi:alkanesulfonate monooxygenase SsuD/methylene tetrahydromethanopterin reductase-like flavin-dependent oxidoreductase (luciferase family)